MAKIRPEDFDFEEDAPHQADFAQSFADQRKELEEWERENGLPLTTWELPAERIIRQE